MTDGVTEYSLLQSKRQIINVIINSLLSKFIKWPENANMIEISNKFNEIQILTIIGKKNSFHYTPRSIWRHFEIYRYQRRLAGQGT